MCHLDQMHEGQLVWCLPKYIYSSLRFGSELLSWPASASDVASHMKEGVRRCELCALTPVAALEECGEEAQAIWDLCYYSEGWASYSPSPFISLLQAPAACFWCAHRSCTIAVLFPYCFPTLIHLVPQCQVGLPSSKLKQRFINQSL